MRNLQRALFSGTRKCTYGCQYCFAKFREYSAEHHLRVLPDHLPMDVSIIYPTCDGEFFTDSHAQNALKRLVHRTTKPLLVSISVKSPITDKNIAYINDINDHLTTMGRGFLKCSISISIKHGLEKIEPHTPRYGQRLDAAHLLALHGIPRSVNLMPILPFVPV
jgi:DNA repair photolyase